MENRPVIYTIYIWEGKFEIKTTNKEFKHIGTNLLDMKFLYSEMHRITCELNNEFNRAVLFELE